MSKIKINLEPIIEFQERIFLNKKISPSQIKTAEQYVRELKVVLDKGTADYGVLKAAGSLHKKLSEALEREITRHKIRTGEVVI